MNDDWATLVSHYERCFHRHGASPRGVDWPDSPDLEARFATLLSVLDGMPDQPSPVLLDVGCGPGLLLDYMRATGCLERVTYHGIDLSSVMVEAARRRWPGRDFTTRDTITNPLPTMHWSSMTAPSITRNTKPDEVCAPAATTAPRSRMSL